MPNPKISLESGCYYHIYNRGINGCELFREPTNYEYFLKLYEKHISPVAETYAWCLMGNHFHLLVKIKEVDFFLFFSPHLEGFKNLRGEVDDAKKNLSPEKRINQQFSNLFNAYSKAYNKKYHRTGSLVEHSFRRKHITNDEYLRNVVLYIHNNPVHHGFCKHPMEYAWSSYLECLSSKEPIINREEVINWFEDEKNFKYAHNQNLNIDISGFEEQ